VLLFACNDQTDTTKTNELKDPITNNATVARDSTTIPSWMYDEIKHVDIYDLKDSQQYKIEEITPLNNGSLLAVTHYYGLVNGGAYLLSFQNKKLKDFEVINENVDWDLSIPNIPDSKEYILKEGNRFLVTTYYQEVADTSLINADGWFKPGHDLDNVEIKKDSTVTLLSPLDNGMIKRDTLIRSHAGK